MNALNMLVESKQFRLETGLNEKDDIRGYIEKNYTESEVVYLLGTYSKNNQI